MDTFDLTEMAWGIIVSASEVSDTLKAEPGQWPAGSKPKMKGCEGLVIIWWKSSNTLPSTSGYWDFENAEAVTATMICSFAAELCVRMESVLSTPMKNRLKAMVIV